MGFDIVLHGHEHQCFAATLGHIEVSDRIMAILGGAAAKDGFQLVRFNHFGEVLIERFTYGFDQYSRKESPIIIWSSGESRHLEWERERRRSGWFERVDIFKALDPYGDVTQEYDFTQIHGPEGGYIAQNVFRVTAEPPELGACRLHQVRDKSTGLDAPKERLQSLDKNVEYIYYLEPPARNEKPHRGMLFRTQQYNTFATTSREAALRNHRPTEKIWITTRYPVRRLTHTLRFPNGRAPTEIPDVWACDVSSTERDWVPSRSW